MYKALLIFVGGGGGSLLRFLLAQWVQGAPRIKDVPVFPVGTLVVNVLGSLAIGVLGAMFAQPHSIRDEYRAAIFVGVLGGFTTFSAFSYETLTLCNAGEWGKAVANVILTNVVCLAAVCIGFYVTRSIVGDS